MLHIDDKARAKPLREAHSATLASADGGWRDAHPLEGQLASLNGVLALPPADHLSDRKRPRPIHAFSATPHDGQRPYRTLDRIGEISGRHCQLGDAADCQAA